MKERSLRLSRKGNGFVIALAISTLFSLKWFKQVSLKIVSFCTIENILRKKYNEKINIKISRCRFPQNNNTNSNNNNKKT